jgi:hypothetical protein
MARTTAIAVTRMLRLMFLGPFRIGLVVRGSPYFR